MVDAFWKNFLGNSLWYKQAIIAFLVLNPLILYTAGRLLLDGY